MSRYTKAELTAAITEAMDMAYKLDEECSVVERGGRMFPSEFEAENGQVVIVPAAWITEYMGDAAALAAKVFDCED